MSRNEFLRWGRFYELYPFDDLHRYHRPAAVVAASFGGGDVQPILDWLQPDRGMLGMTDADVATMRAMGFTKKGS